MRCLLLRRGILRSYRAAFAAMVLTGLLAVWCGRTPVAAAASQSAAERGRLVYLSEGCPRCHSQNLRQSAQDVGARAAERRAESGGDAEDRKGPDLSEVGERRSELWLKMHLYDPRGVSGSSIMPSYAALFRSRKGNDLVAYLASLRSAANSYMTEEQTWHLPPGAVSNANPAEGQSLYHRYCATCHNPNGRTRARWQSEFIESPAILRAGAMQSQPDAMDHVARIIKFGIPESDMAGHEHMPDDDIGSLSVWLTQKTAQTLPK